MNEPKSPLMDTMWMRCLFIEKKLAERDGRDTLEFSRVDKLVLDYARMPYEAMLKLFKEHGYEI